MRSLLTLSFFLIFSSGYSQIIPEDRRMDWSVAGQQAFFADPQDSVSVMDFGAVGDGVTDDSQAMQDAIDSFAGMEGVVGLPQGDYLIHSTVQLADNIVLRGIDSLSTRVLIDFSGQNNHGFVITGAAPYDFYTIVSGYDFKSSVIVVPDGDVFLPGDYAEIIQDNGDWDTEPATWAEDVVGQMVKIVAVNDNDLVLEHPLRISFQAAFTPRIRKIEPIRNVAIENLKIMRLDEPDEGAGSNIYINLAAGIRLQAIESDKSVGSHIGIYRSTQVVLHKSYIHHAFTYDGSGTRGYGITLHNHSGECLIEDNVFRYLRHAMMVKTGANGNVFGYNYSREPYRSETIHDYSGDISLHGHYAFMNLFEGNIVQNIIIDHYWGPSGPFNTFFRNRAELYGFVITSSDNPSDQQNIVGQEITDEDFLYGLYSLDGEDHFEYGNYVTGDIMPFETDSLPDSSYYKSVVPDYWNTSLPWPSVGIPLEAEAYTNPAWQRYFGIHVANENLVQEQILVYPNPVKDRLMIEGVEFSASVRIFSVNGVCVLKAENQNSLDVSGLQNGLYFLWVETDSGTSVQKVMIFK